jgi:hypothetical protein
VEVTLGNKKRDINRKQLANVRYVRTDRGCSTLNHIRQRMKILKEQKMQSARKII